MKRILICALVTAGGLAQGTEVTSVIKQQSDFGAESLQYMAGQELEALPLTSVPDLTRMAKSRRSGVVETLLPVAAVTSFANFAQVRESRAKFSL